MTATKTIFRVWPNGEVIALFPEIPADALGHYCQSYQHIGQHGAADTGIVADTRLASPREYLPLKRELTRLGYRKLRVIARVPRNAFNTRKRALAR